MDQNGEPPIGNAAREDILLTNSCISVLSFHLMNVVQDAAWDADRPHRQLANRLVLDAARHVDDHTLMQLNRLVVAMSMTKLTWSVEPMRASCFRASCPCSCRARC